MRSAADLFMGIAFLALLVSPTLRQKSLLAIQMKFVETYKKRFKKIGYIPLEKNPAARFFKPLAKDEVPSSLRGIPQYDRWAHER